MAVVKRCASTRILHAACGRAQVPAVDERQSRRRARSFDEASDGA